MAISPSEFRRRMRAAQRQVEQQFKQVETQLKRDVAAHNRKIEAQNRKALAERSRLVDQHNRRAQAHNKKLIDDINHRLAAAGRSSTAYSQDERVLVERVQHAIPQDSREYDIFLSYARIDGSRVANELCSSLVDLGLSVWFDELIIRPGKSLSLQMDQGLRKARAGVVVLTPAYLTGRFWTERELGALLHKETLIPVLSGVTFEDVKQYSGILPDLAGFTTEIDSVPDIAAKIAGAFTVDA
ncbi:toll/interleukin-1 receptor domain-containing protein [Micromonospora sp. NPDC049089]|uniref:toll/interleukin-1 receptor domain-containing protein n=1 Tax=Micromonospora sp. NPDC049089 TaxID=3155496 RepID=UPI0034020D48